jgi:hypothetical protein
MQIIPEALVNVARKARDLPHGTRSDYYQEAAQSMGISVATLHRQLNKVAAPKQRKQRSDAGAIELSREEAMIISTLLVESIRKNRKQTSSIELAVERLRANNLIRAQSINPETGETWPLSISTISRALYHYQCHPKQVLQPQVAIALASKHPNHVWQVDASISAQFYLANDGLRALDPKLHYAGKPDNLEKIKRQRLWRYVITDHTSGTLYVEYVLGAESAENLCNVLINAMQKRQQEDPFHGVPMALMTDPGAAMTSSIFVNLCDALDINLIINKVGNARAKGQVEQAHNIVECNFESGLKLQPATSLAQINDQVWRWMRFFNATSRHTRTQQTRYSTWLRIQPEQLRLSPPVSVCRELANTKPEERVVNTMLRVSFRGSEYDVRNVPGTIVGESVLMTRNPWNDEATAKVIRIDSDGRKVHHIVSRVERGEFGFAVDAAIVGDNFKRHSETYAEQARKLMEQIATGTTSEEDAALARKAKVTPFSGAIDPHKHIADTPLPAALPRRGTVLNISIPTIEIAPLSHIEAAKILSHRLGGRWNVSTDLAWLRQEYPHGVPEEALNDIAQLLRQPLRVVNGEGA